MFQICAGAALAVLPVRPPRRPWAELSTLAGLSAIVYAALRFDADTSRQHLWSLLPVVGAVMLIAAGGSAAMSRILSNRLVVSVGTISYSLYLVHWPLVVFHKYVYGPRLEPWSRVSLTLLTFLSAAGLYYCVERPFRSGAAASRWWFRVGRLPLACGAAAAAIVALGGSAWHSGGWPSRLPQELRSIPSETAMWRQRNPFARVGTCFIDSKLAPSFDEKACLAIDPVRPNYLIFGDSFAADAYVYLSAAYPGVNFLQATAASCRPIIGLEGDASCRDLLRLVFEEFLPRGRVDGIVLAGAWQVADLDPLAKTVNRLRSVARRIVLVGSGVRFQANVTTLIFQSRGLTTAAVEAYAGEHIAPLQFSLNKSVRRRIGPKVAAYVNVQSIMCEGHCRLFSPEGQMMYVDFGHLTLAGARYLAPRIAARYPDLFPRTTGSDKTSSRAQPTPVASRVAARDTADSTLPLIASARTSPAACSHARIRHRWSMPPRGFTGFAMRTVTFCTRPPNRLRARCTRRTTIARTATDRRGSAPVTSILNALPLASI